MRVYLEFTAEPDKLNEWVIPIPDELIEQAREFLKEHPPANVKED